uniref:Uncharacterized protein n=1 Tax=Eutreptiella gymnastica TaxID=73025 RepID=A0A7S4LKF8_9EUGL
MGVAVTQENNAGDFSKIFINQVPISPSLIPQVKRARQGMNGMERESSGCIFTSTCQCTNEIENSRQPCVCVTPDGIGLTQQYRNQRDPSGNNISMNQLLHFSRLCPSSSICGWLQHL